MTVLLLATQMNLGFLSFFPQMTNVLSLFNKASQGNSQTGKQGMFQDHV